MRSNRDSVRGLMKSWSARAAFGAARRAGRWFVLSALFFATIVGPALGDLRHRYTFNDGNVNDSVGTANGTLFGNAVVNSSGILQLAGGSDYVGLPGPQINISSYVDATFEAWFTFNQATAWQRVFDFGDRSASVPTASQGYVYYTPQNGAGVGLGVISTANNRIEAPGSALQVGRLYHLAMVLDDNGGANNLKVYLDGVQQASVNHNRSLSGVLNTFAYLGKSLVSDPNFNGSIDEFRIYDNALSASEVQSNFIAGPTPGPNLRLEVNAVTGATSILNGTNGAVMFDYYSIRSPANRLSVSGWTSLDSQGTDAIGAGTGESWDIQPDPTSSDLVEFYLQGASTLDVGERISLGHAFNQFAGGQGQPGDLQFKFSRKGSQILQTGQVQYIVPPLSAGDYNDDSAVNAADYTIWRNTLGSTSDLRADGDGNGKIDRDDYVVWKWSYGHVGPGSGTAVPEPATGVTAILCILPIISGLRRKRR